MVAKTVSSHSLHGKTHKNWFHIYFRQAEAQEKLPATKRHVKRYCGSLEFHFIHDIILTVHIFWENLITLYIDLKNNKQTLMK